MSFADRIRHCNSYDPARAMPLWADGHRIGWLRRDNAEALKRHGKVFEVRRDRAELLAEGSCDKVSRTVDDVVEALVAERRLPKWRNETFDVARRWGEPPIFRLDRGAVPFFGVRAYGVHLNDFTATLTGVDHHQWFNLLATKLGIDQKALIWESARVYVSGLRENETSTLVALLKEASQQKKTT